MVNYWTLLFLQITLTSCYRQSSEQVVSKESCKRIFNMKPQRKGSGFKIQIFQICLCGVYVYMCVCVRERERESETSVLHIWMALAYF